MKFYLQFLFFSLFAAGTWAAPAPDVDMDYIHAMKSGGETTVTFKGETVQAFRSPAANLSEAELRRHLSGDALFERNFSDDPLRQDRGLGPVYNNTSCNACHARDGRGALPVVPAGQEWVTLRQNESVFLRISIEDGKPRQKTAEDRFGAPRPVPGFSDQLFHLGSLGVREDQPGLGQAQVEMKFEPSSFVYPDGEKVALRRPLFRVRAAYDEYFDSVTGAVRSRLLESDVRMGPRIGTPMMGLGLLEAIRESDILALAARDLSAEGVSGKPNSVFDIEKSMKGDPRPISLGRFGLKANTPSVFHQSLGALRGDLGVTNYAFPQESIAGTPLFAAYQQNHPSSSSGVGVEAPRDVADDLVFYSQTLAVPSRRNVEEPEVLRGAQIFHELRCTSCHQPSFVTGEHPIAAFSHQKIYPYTDLLLHDMGEGLADGRQDFDADGREWKTRPLWGLGHTQTVNPRAGYLHDGRARTVEEAILWHGGEAEHSRSLFAHLNKADRNAVLQFLHSL